jgi:hypothetical protein
MLMELPGSSTIIMQKRNEIKTREKKEIPAQTLNSNCFLALPEGSWEENVIVNL